MNKPHTNAIIRDCVVNARATRKFRVAVAAHERTPVSATLMVRLGANDQFVSTLLKTIEIRWANLKVVQNILKSK